MPKLPDDPELDQRPSVAHVTPSHGLNTATRVHTRILIVTQPQILMLSLSATVSSLLDTVMTISQPILNIYT